MEVKRLNDEVRLTAINRNDIQVRIDHETYSGIEDIFFFAYDADEGAEVATYLDDEDHFNLLVALMPRQDAERIDLIQRLIAHDYSHFNPESSDP